jgi:hypothetical protein
MRVVFFDIAARLPTQPLGAALAKALAEADFVTLHARDAADRR